MSFSSNNPQTIWSTETPLWCGKETPKRKAGRFEYESVPAKVPNKSNEFNPTNKPNDNWKNIWSLQVRADRSPE